MRRKPLALLALLLVSRLAAAFALQTSNGNIELSRAGARTEIILSTANGSLRLQQEPKLRHYLGRAERATFVGRRVMTELDDQLQVQSCERGEHLDIDHPESTEQVVSALKLAGNELALRTRYSFSATPDAVVSRRYTIGRRFQPAR